MKDVSSQIAQGSPRFPSRLLSCLPVSHPTWNLPRAVGFLSLAIVLVFGASSTKARVISANSANYNDVAAAVASAVDGDIVSVPSGNVNWTQSLRVVDKAITIRGAGTNSTIITDKINPRKPVFDIEFTKRTGMCRVTGFQIKGSSQVSSDNFSGIIRVLGSNYEFNNSAWRVDNIYFNRHHGRPLNIYAWSGLIDTCYIDQNGSPGMSFDGRVPNSLTKGHRSWATPVRKGTVDAGVYVENCFITNIRVRAITDGFAGARFVFRFNTCVNVAAENHGTESTGIFRGTRSMEIYGNNFHANTRGEYAVLVRSGTALVFSNHVSGVFPGLMRMVNYRERDPYSPFGQANAINPWDQNDPTIHASGRHRTSGSSVLEDTSKNWTANQWVGYHVINTTTGKAGQIESNTGTTITVHNSIHSHNKPSWSNNDRYEIRKIIRTLDGCGQGMGDLLTGGANTGNVQPTPIGWPNQADDPIRYWDNTGLTHVSNDGYYTIVQGRNYVNSKLPGYQPLVYPHPYVNGNESNPPDAPRNLRFVSN